MAPCGDLLREGRRGRGDVAGTLVDASYLLGLPLSHCVCFPPFALVPASRRLWSSWRPDSGIIAILCSCRGVPTPPLWSTLALLPPGSRGGLGVPGPHPLCRSSRFSLQPLLNRSAPPLPTWIRTTIGSEHASATISGMWLACGCRVMHGAMHDARCRVRPRPTCIVLALLGDFDSLAQGGR